MAALQHIPRSLHPPPRVHREAMYQKRVLIFTPVLHAKRTRLKEMEHWQEVCDTCAAAYPKTCMWGVFAFLAGQASILFDWTYAHFDWNLVEPITYLIGYSATWMSLAWYGNMQTEYGYDSVQQLLHDNRQRVLYRKYGVDVKEIVRLRDEVALLEKLVRACEPPKASPDRSGSGRPRP